MDIIQVSTPEQWERLRDALQSALERDDRVSLLRLAHENYPEDFASVLDTLDFDLVVSAVRTLLLSEISYCAEALISLDTSTLARIYPFLKIPEWAIVLNELSDDDVVWLLELFPEPAREQLVARIPEEEQNDVRQLMNYPEDSAGRIMTTEFLALDENQTVEHAIEQIRGSRDLDPINLMFVYVTRNKELVGQVSLRQLLLQKRPAKLGSFMRTDVIPVHVNLDQEEVAEIVSKHDEVTVPVIDDNNHVRGIITVDDVLDVIQEESEEDLYQMIGTSDEELLVRDKTFKIVSLRLPWIMASFAGSLLVVMIMRFTERDVFGEDAARIFTFVPMISAMGGNVGVQSSTIMARLLSNHSLNFREARTSTIKEAKVGLSLGVVCGFMIGFFALYWGGLGMMLTVLTAMMCTLTAAAITGTVIPIAMKRIGFDPALATGPFVTSFNDFIAVCVYFSIVFVLRDYFTI
ncbi:magnesium transporter [Acanthopleuribacter pedis]|uniref:Magnesium transporter MgtE n=1 Tax=Acanthopleuribacter pedis TaxID=442870 RepID=A0A8J7QMV8_9BACT|nr:magnesium transporter [Acanthopleuribacter pedis]MBO1321323.1 magnesium transporter [Acanthopleuribacter pedis]